MEILVNGKFYTQNPEKPVVSAIAIQNGKIFAAGTTEDLLNLSNDQTIITDMGNKTIWPGFTDAHIHFEHYSLTKSAVFCETETKQDCLENVKEFAKLHPVEKWIIGWGWNQNVWEDGFGTKEDLDWAAPQHPVFLNAKSGHAAWANSKALELSGINKDTPNPEGGVIQKDEQGNPTGILFETAIDLVSKHIPQNSIEDTKKQVLIGQGDLLSMGITSIHDFDSPLLFSALQQLEKQNELKIRVAKGIPEYILDEAAATGIQTGFGSDLLNIGFVKLFVDGALGPQTAAMLEPFENSTDKGILLKTSDEIFEIGKKASSNGLAMAIHAIGDLANREVLNAYEMLRNFEKENKLPHLINRIEHVQLLHPDDINRLAKLNVTGSVQPIHTTSDIDISDEYWGKRASGAYAFKTLLANNTNLAFGSDAPVETPNPFVGLHAAVTRQRSNGYPGENGWYPEQRLSLSEALSAYTIGPAVSIGKEHVIGKLDKNFFADLIVLDVDPFAIPPSELHTIKPCATMVNGEWVFREM